MNKEFFDSFGERISAFSDRAKAGDHVRAELILSTGRIYVIDTVVEAAEAWVQIDGHDVNDDTLAVSLTLPYHQISHILLTKQKERPRHTGFARSS